MQVIPDGNGYILSVSNDFQTLLTFAEAYFHIGYSVIPLLGDLDPSRPKVPAMPWASFQKQRATLTEHQHWFAQAGFAGLGIVTGRVSQLVALDFDSEAVFNTFKYQYPDLLETHTVRSAGRQLPHLYFRLPPHLHLASQKGQGIDLLSEGRYVVAPPTTINGQAYKISRGGMPKTLTERDIRRLHTFLNAHKASASPISTPTVPPTPVNTPVKQPTDSRSTDHDLHALYHHLAAVRGRNEALFHTSLFARDQRLTLQQTENVLVTLHSQQKTGSTHARENIQQREREALKTIRSAFSRPARVAEPQVARQHGYLSNSIREALMQKKMTYVIRTYEGLLASGMYPGQRFTTDEALKRLKGLVGRDSILKALKAGQGAIQFFAVPPPVSPRNTTNVVAYSHTEKRSKKCFLIVSKNQEKIMRGRPKTTYKLPNNQKLCQILGLKATGSDLIERADLSSARKTRMALHRELIKRRPGYYPKRWLASRLGVSRRTIFTYNHLLPIHSRAMFLETEIRWKTIERLPLDEPLQGAFLQTLRGKKYPALRQIASRLLANGEQVWLKQQTVNFYWYGDVEPSSLEWIKSSEQQIHKQKVMETFLSQQSTNTPNVGQPIMTNTAHLLPVPQVHQEQNSRSFQSDYKKPLKNDGNETLALRLYEALNQMQGVEFKKLSRATARRLVATYDETLLWNTLDRIKKKSREGNVRNPVGFFLILIRSLERKGISVFRDQIPAQV